jgi:hypothetical protein
MIEAPCSKWQTRRIIKALGIDYRRADDGAPHLPIRTACDNPLRFHNTYLPGGPSAPRPAPTVESAPAIANPGSQS